MSILTESHYINEGPPIVLIDALMELVRETPDEVAEYLREIGVHGKQGSKSSCPLANYLRRNPGVTDARVDNRIAVISVDGHIETVMLPDVLDHFVRCVDVRRYPFLLDSDPGVE